MTYANLLRSDPVEEACVSSPPHNERADDDNDDASYTHAEALTVEAVLTGSNSPFTHLEALLVDAVQAHADFLRLPNGSDEDAHSLADRAISSYTLFTKGCQQHARQECIPRSHRVVTSLTHSDNNGPSSRSLRWCSVSSSSSLVACSSFRPRNGRWSSTGRE